MSSSAMLPPGVSRIESLAVPWKGTSIGIQLLSCDAHEFDLEAFAEERILLPPWIARCAHKRQAEFFFGRYAAKLAIRAVGGPVADVLIGAAREPLWPAGLIGSITHTADFAAASVAHGANCNGLGIDIERVAGEDELAALCSLVVSNEELQLVDSLVSRFSRSHLLTMICSAKESLFKAVFAVVRRFFDFHSARVVDIRPEANQLIVELQEYLCPEFPRGIRCTIHVGEITEQTLFTSFVW